MDAEPPGATGFAGQFDRAGFGVLGAMEMPFGFEAPTEVLVEDDDQLRRALSFQREALGSRSPFYRVLAYWNA